jgi:hypothetical protein
MKIRNVSANNHKKAFEVRTYKGSYNLPYASLETQPLPDNKVRDVAVDPELGNEAFTYSLESGAEDSIHIARVLEYNKDPAYMRDLLLYKLTLEAKKHLEKSALSKRELIRRLNTSPAQFYRILDEDNYRKSIDQVIGLLSVLDCRVDFSVERAGESRGSPVSRVGT